MEKSVRSGYYEITNQNPHISILGMDDGDQKCAEHHLRSMIWNTIVLDGDNHWWRKK